MFLITCGIREDGGGVVVCDCIDIASSSAAIQGVYKYNIRVQVQSSKSHSNFSHRVVTVVFPAHVFRKRSPNGNNWQAIVRTARKAVIGDGRAIGDLSG